MRTLLLLIALTLLATPAFSRDNPLEPFAKSVGGIWVAEEALENPDAPYVMTQAEWGLERRTIRSHVWNVADGKKTLIMEGGVYWHPGHKRAVTWAVDSSGTVMEATMAIEEDVLVSKWRFVTEGQSAEGENRTTYTGNDILVAEEFMMTPDGLRHFRTRKMVRKPVDWRETEPAEEGEAETPAGMKLMERHVGGNWVVVRDAWDADDDADFYRVNWGFGRRIAYIRTFELTKGKVTKKFEGAHYWHPRRKEVVFFQVGLDGTLFEGTSSEERDVQQATWTAWHEGREIKLRQTIRFTGKDTSKSTIFEQDNGRWDQQMFVEFVRKQEGWQKRREE